MFKFVGKALSGKNFNLGANLLSGGLIPLGSNKMLDPMGLFKAPEKPAIETVDPAKEQADAENKAAAAANAKAANRKRAGRNSSLLATGGAGVNSPAQTQSLLAYGKQKLGD